MKKIQLDKLIIGLHPLVMELTKRDLVSDCIFPSNNDLSILQLSALLENIILNVIVADDGRYLLLTPNPLYNLLTQHPASRKMSVHLLIHSPNNEQDLITIIDALNLIQPALSFLDHAHKSKTINARFRCLNEMGAKPTSLASLERLANKKKSAFRGK